jgi:hypothetical protein
MLSMTSEQLNHESTQTTLDVVAKGAITGNA